VDWQQTWQEKSVGEITHKLKTIVKELEAMVPTIIQRREEAQKQAEIEHQRWEAQHREWERQEKERRRAEALKASREQLVTIVEAWSFARSFDTFFQDVEQRASILPADERAKLIDRISQARTMLGGADTLVEFRAWKSPDES
jgi:hypothetical protein